MSLLQAPPKSPSLLAAAARHRLLLITAGPALNGSVATLASSGSFQDPVVLVGLALTGIGGAGAFSLAAVEFGPRGDRRLFWAIAALSTVLIVATALAGVWFQAADRPWLRLAGGLGALAVAAQILGVELPEVKGVPAPLALIGLGLAMEVVA